MGTSLYFIFIVLIILSIIVIGKTVYYRKKVPCMTGMMIAMTMGMSVGLTVGVILGILFSGNLFLSTILGMVAGMVIGFLAGVPVSIMAVLDGLLSGIMGGMMGSMLGEMIAPEYRGAITQLMFFLFLSTMLILLYMLQKELKRNGAFFYNNPLALIALFGSIFLLFNLLGPIFPETDSTNQNHIEHSANKKSLIIIADGFSFSPNKINMKVGQEVTLSIENTDDIEHDLEIIGLKAENTHGNKTHNHSQASNRIHLHARPGEKQSVTFSPAEPGMYQFICTVPGHKESGMVGTIEVT